MLTLDSVTAQVSRVRYGQESLDQDESIIKMKVDRSYLSLYVQLQWMTDQLFLMKIKSIGEA